MIISLLVGEINDYYINKDILKRSEAENERLEKLDTEYDLELARLEHDPNVISRLNRLTIGENPEEDETTFPIASAEDLIKAEYVLKDTPKPILKEDPIRNIVNRCLETKIRKSLFVAGAGLVIITFIFFGRGKSKID